ncbi:type IV toxin-antitoxin system AbiEi family antitoxin domain-containing protein [Kribbella sp. NPDC051587]|uniref:type IV toxin-antitoxin system AbiEi family antitoxin domain-containing protein n=1 Tax=Kribbella sp. NPDC051587 TaxID=3364119 RepID=UPI00379481A0
MSAVQSLDALESLELVGSGQWGLVTTSQADQAGVSKMQLSRLAERGTLQRVRHGIYALPSADTGPLLGLRAAWLATGSRPSGQQPLAVVSGESAAAVHGLGDLLPSKYEFSTAVRRQTTQADTRYRKRDLPDEDVTWVNGLPVTTVARTLRDLAAGGTDLDHLAVAVRDAVSMSDPVSVGLARALAPTPARSGSANTSAVLGAALKASGYQPPPELLELLLLSTLPDTKPLAMQRDDEASDAAGRPNKDAEDGAPDDSTGSGPIQEVPGDEAG